MRMLLKALIPNEPFNTLVKEGTAGKVIAKIMDEIKPEAAYFTEQNGKRCALCVIDLADAADIPRFAEPFFLKFNAETHFSVVMLPADLHQAGLDELRAKMALVGLTH